MARFSQKFINAVMSYNNENTEITEYVDPVALADFLEKDNWVLWHKFDPVTEQIVSV